MVGFGIMRSLLYAMSGINITFNNQLAHWGVFMIVSEHPLKSRDCNPARDVVRGRHAVLLVLLGGECGYSGSEAKAHGFSG